MYNYNSSSPAMTSVSASATGGSTSYGVYNYLSSSPVMTDVSASASGGTTNYGVFNESSSPVMTNVSASASGGLEICGVSNYSSSVVIQDSVIVASGGTYNHGICNTAPSGSYTVKINNSQVTGGTDTIANGSNITTRIGASLLDGGAVDNYGTLTCAGVYDEAYAFYASTCP